MLASTQRLAATLAAALLAAVPLAAHAKDDAPKKVVCKDGTTDDGGRGACSGHGGVDKDKTAAAAEGKKDGKKKHHEDAKDEGKKDGKDKKDARKDDAPKKVTCKDGTTDDAGRGACSGHGGVDKDKGAPTASGDKDKHHHEARGDDDGKKDDDKKEKESGKRHHEEAVAPPAGAAVPAAADAKADPSKGPPTAKCKDGTLSYSEHHTGTCANHGGVAEWLDKK